MIKKRDFLDKNNLSEKIGVFFSSDLVKRIIKGASWILIGTVLSKLILLLSSIVVARLLGKEQYGELGILRSTINSFSMMANMGLGITATKFIAENITSKKRDIGEVIGFTIILSVFFATVIGLILVFFSDYVANIIASKHLKNEIIYSAFILLFVTINSAQLGVLAGFERFDLIAKGTLIGALISFVFQVIGTYYLGVKGALIGFGANYFLLFLFFSKSISKTAAKNNIKIVFNKFKKYKHLLIKISLPAALSGILVSPIFWLCNAILVNQENGYNNMAILDASNQWQQIILFIPTALSQLLLPILASYSNDKENFKKAFKYNIILNLIIAFVLFVIISFTADFIMAFYGKKFIEGSKVLVLMTLATLPMIVSNLIGQTLVAKERVWVAFLFNLVWGVSIIYLCYLFVNEYKMGVLGYAYSFLLSYIIHMLINLFYIKFKKE